MKKYIILWFLTALVMASDAPKIEKMAEEFTLDNGMKWVVIRKPGLATVSAGWVAHVGSANERPGITGISHLFEHMMFKGSDRIGVKDAALDRDINNQLDQIREQMFVEERAIRAKVRKGYGSSMNDANLSSERLTELKKQFEELVKRQRENLIKDEFDKIYTGEGGVGMNAFTNEDMTVYFISVPKNKIELWFWMESERLSRPVFREFYSERDVVYEERRMRTDSTPTGAQDEIFSSMLWGNTTYNWPVVGWPSDISAITRAQAAEYFDIFYAPNNLTACVVGDVDPAVVKAFAQQYFGRIPRGKTQPPDVITLPIDQRGERVYTAEVDSAPESELYWRAVSYNGSDAPALDVLGEVLSGKSGRLYKRLVLGDQIATRVGANLDARKYGGAFGVFAEGKNDTDPAQLQAALLEELENIKKNGITPDELTRVMNSLKGNQFRQLDNPFWLMVQVLITDGLSYDWRDLDRYQERINEVTAADVQRVANTYLTLENRNTKRFSRKAEAASSDPDLAELSSENQAMVRRAWQGISAAPAEMLPNILEQLQSSAGSVPAEAKLALDVLIKRVQAKINQGEAK